MSGAVARRWSRKSIRQKSRPSGREGRLRRLFFIFSHLSLFYFFRRNDQPQRREGKLKRRRKSWRKSLRRRRKRLQSARRRKLPRRKLFRFILIFQILLTLLMHNSWLLKIILISKWSILCANDSCWVYLFFPTCCRFLLVFSRKIMFQNKLSCWITRLFLKKILDHPIITWNSFCFQRLISNKLQKSSFEFQNGHAMVLDRTPHKKGPFEVSEKSRVCDGMQ